MPAIAGSGNAVTPTAPGGTPDYNHDIVGGLDAPLTYDIDIAQPPGSRIKNLQYAGTPVVDAGVRDGDQQLPAVRRRGFPGVTTAPVVSKGSRSRSADPAAGR